MVPFPEVYCKAMQRPLSIGLPSRYLYLFEVKAFIERNKHTEICLPSLQPRCFLLHAGNEKHVQIEFMTKTSTYIEQTHMHRGTGIVP